MSAPTLTPGAVLSYSAGSTSADPFRFRDVRPAEGKFAALLQNFPQLGALLTGGRPPLVINAYPAPLPALSSCISVDSYCVRRPSGAPWNLPVRRAARPCSSPCPCWRSMLCWAFSRAIEATSPTPC